RRELHLRTRAERAQEVMRTRERFQDRHALAIGIARTAGIDDEVSDLGLRARAAQRAIEQRYAAFGERDARFFLDGDRQRARLDDDPAASAGARELGGNLRERLRAGE